MPDLELLAVSGLLAGLVIATVVPFALPALELADDGSPATVRDKSDPAGVSTDRGGPTPAYTAARTTTDGSTTARSPRCDADSVMGASDRVPVTVEGETISGENVSVAVIDPSGFDVDDPRIGKQVAATRSFSTRESLAIGNGGRDRHGTESAAVVARIAPDADLYLANFRTAYDFTQAVAWAIEEDVDLIVAPVAFYAKPNDGTAPVSEAVTGATEQGIPVIAPTGNVASRHWEGTYRGGPWLEFQPNDTRLYLEGGAGPVEVWLWWNETGDDGPNDFRVVLYEDHGDTVERIATSRDYPRGPVGTNQVLFEKVETNNLLSRQVPNGTFFLRVEGPEGATHRVELVAATHRLAEPVARGSIGAPASARGSVIAVGAARASMAEPLASSSRGPTNDGRPGIDVIAPGTAIGSDDASFTGTSAAAAFTGGVVALMTAVDPSLSPAMAEAILHETARPAGPAGFDLQTGYGLVDPGRAVACAARAD